MKQFFYKNPEVTLAVLALFFIGLLLAIFSWGMGNIVGALDTATNSRGTANVNSGFYLDQAKALNLRGLVK